jgi:SAM-dependent methyltransferase
MGEDTRFCEPQQCVCGSGDGEIVALQERHGLPLNTKLCGCGILRSDPYYSDDDLKEFYEGEYRERYSNNPVKTFKEGFDYGKAIIQLAESLEIKYDSVLDMGCGAGGACAAIPNAIGYGFDEKLVNYGKNKGAKVQVGKIDGVYDLVILNHVLEHQKDPVAFLKGMKNQVGKYLWVSLPGIASIGEAYPNINEYLQDAHVYHFTLKTLMYTLSLAGFRLVAGSEGVMSFFEKGGEPLETPELGPKIREYLVHIAEVEAVQSISRNKRDASYFNTREPWV